MSLWDVFISVLRGTPGKNIGISVPLGTGYTKPEEPKMIFTQTRTQKSKDGIFGTLAVDIDPFKCVTLDNLALAIPPGTYDLTIMWSDHFQQLMPHLIVPGRVAIEVHWANFPVGPDPAHPQLEGCVALGTSAEFASDCIDQSKVAWIAFAKTISDQPNIKWKIVEDYG